MDFSDPTKLLIGGGLLAALAAGWPHVRSFLNWLRSFAIVSADMHGGSPEAVLGYMRRHYRVSHFGSRTYVAWRRFVRPLFRREWVAMESVGGETKLFWRGWLPIWVGRAAGHTSKDDQTSFLYKPVRVTFFRGTLDVDRLGQSAVDEYNAISHDADDGTRYRIVYVHGSGDKPTQGLFGSGPRHDACMPNDDGNMEMVRGCR